jgi:hypothetical protein
VIVVGSEVLIARERTHTALRSRARIAAIVFIVVVLGVEAVLVAPHIAQASRSLRHLDVRWLALALAAEAASMAMFARLQQRMVTAGGVRIPVHRMIGVTYAANAMSVTLPAGQAASLAYLFRKLRAWGAGGSLVTFALFASGLLSTVTLAAILVLGATFAGQGSTGPLLIVGEVIAAVAGAVALRRLMRRPDVLLRVGSRLMRWADKVLRRPPDTSQAQLAAVIDEFILIRPRSRDWLLGLLFATLNWTFDLCCLVVACHAVGAHGPSLDLALITYAAGMTASSVPLLPGGLGVVDGVLILALVRGGFAAGTATAGVLIYRLISLGLVALIGWLLWLVVERAERRRLATI